MVGLSCLRLPQVVVIPGYFLGEFVFNQLLNLWNQDIFISLRDNFSDIERFYCDTRILRGSSYRREGSDSYQVIKWSTHDWTRERERERLSDLQQCYLLSHVYSRLTLSPVSFDIWSCSASAQLISRCVSLFLCIPNSNKPYLSCS